MAENITFERLQQLLSNASYNIDYRGWVHDRIADGWPPTYNSWHRMQAERVEDEVNQFTDVDFSE